ncbi:MAG: hypothetical protein R3C27_15905 [Hyphomonadaceae bacterium]
MSLPAAAHAVGGGTAIEHIVPKPTSQRVYADAAVALLASLPQ